MKEILRENQKIKPLKKGDIVEGKIIEKKSFAVFLDLGIFGTGIIYGKEFKKAKDELKKLNVGDKILAKVVELENDEGFVELSVSGASKDIALEMLRKKKEAGEKIKIKILGANKGGLLTEISGISGFLPVSQLSPGKYPQVEDGNTEKILEKLQKFIGQEMEVKILGVLENEKQVILSEKLARTEENEELKNYNVGDVVEGEICGILDFGIVLKIGENTEGIIPSSELNSENNPFKLGEKIKAKIISISENKIFLSLKNE